MQHKRFFINKYITNRKVVVEERGFINRLKNVLRIKEGERFFVFDKGDNEFLARVTKLDKTHCEIEALGKIENERKPRIQINIFQAIIKKDGFEWVVEKGTETGVSSFTPLITKRTIKTSLNFERLNKIAIEAAEQCGRNRIPKINEITTFAKAIKKVVDKNSLLLDVEGEKLSSFMRVFKNKKEINLFCGPEGGWSKEELVLAKENKIKIANFGPLILRSETIGPMVTAFILNW